MWTLSAAQVLLRKTLALQQLLRLQRTWTRTLSVTSQRINTPIGPDRTRHRKTTVGCCLRNRIAQNYGKFQGRCYATQETSSDRLSMKDDLVRSYVKHLYDKYMDASEILMSEERPGETQVSTIHLANKEVKDL